MITSSYQQLCGGARPSRQLGVVSCLLSLQLCAKPFSSHTNLFSILSVRNRRNFSPWRACLFRFLILALLRSNSFTIGLIYPSCVVIVIKAPAAERLHTYPPTTVFATLHERLVFSCKVPAGLSGFTRGISREFFRFLPGVWERQIYHSIYTGAIIISHRYLFNYFFSPFTFCSTSTTPPWLHLAGSVKGKISD